LENGKARCDLLAKRVKDPNDPLKLVIVRDMWLTGFDAPPMHTMYIDKPMKGHGLMQAIARVNRVFRDKPAGLGVDYIGIAQNLKVALGQYSGSDREQTGINEDEAIAGMLERYEVVRDVFRPNARDGFDYRPALTREATPQLDTGSSQQKSIWFSSSSSSVERNIWFLGYPDPVKQHCKFSGHRDDGSIACLFASSGCQVQAPLS
jgi:type I site-specific restriction-modification system R (restriction) subunit